MARNYDKEYWFEFEDPDTAFNVARGFHESLCGNDDYVDSHIVLSFNGPQVSVFVDRESETNFVIEDGETGPYLAYR